MRCFHHQFLKFALETQIKAYSVFANVQHAEKCVFALFSTSIFEICSRKANMAICSSRKCSTCRKNVFLHCFHFQFLKTALETQIKAYAVVASVQHAEKTRFCTVFMIYFRNCFRNANNGICSSRKCSTCRKTRFCSDFIMNF